MLTTLLRGLLAHRADPVDPVGRARDPALAASLEHGSDAASGDEAEARGERNERDEHVPDPDARALPGLEDLSALEREVVCVRAWA